MLTFDEALRRHSMLADRVGPPDSRREAEEVWAGVTGEGTSTSLVRDAISDTVPVDYSVLVATDDIAAAFAASVLLDSFADAPAPDSPREARAIANVGWLAFRELADQGGHLAHGTGADRSHAWPVIQQVNQLDAKVQARLRHIAALAGKMMQALQGATHRRVPNIPEQVVGVELGNDVQALLPQEYALMALPATRLDTTRRLLERQTLQYRRIGTDRMGRGPLAIALDESGSMWNKGADGPNTWAKAAATALTRLAWQDKREVVWIHFSTATRVSVLRPNDSAALIKAQTSFLDGGTDIGVALRVAALEIRKLAKRGAVGADAVLISDGGKDAEAIARLPYGIDAIKKVDARLFSVGILNEFPAELKAQSSAYVCLEAGDVRRADTVGAMKGAIEA